MTDATTRLSAALADPDGDHRMEEALGLGEPTIMMHRGCVVADLSDGERKATRVSDFLERFASLRHTIEYTVQHSTTPPA